MAWKDEQHFEADWWGSCLNTYGEETKQLSYFKRMGLKAESRDGKYPVIDLTGKTIIDIGGGPVSLLLKCVNFEHGMVIDPCMYPEWIKARYKIAKIDYLRAMAEETFWVPKFRVDEVWIYNVLQHVESPKKIIENAKEAGMIIRIFEWIEMPPSPGHPHTLTSKKLNTWLEGEGKVEDINENGCHGKCYYGIFKGNHY